MARSKNTICIRLWFWHDGNGFICIRLWLWHARKSYSHSLEPSLYSSGGLRRRR